VAASDDAIAQITRWMARLMSVGLAALLVYLGLVAIVRVHGQAAVEPLLTTQGIITVDLWGVVVAGLLLAFVWEGIGGAIAALAGLTMYTYSLWQQPEQFDALALLCVLVGLAYLFCWWRAWRPLRRPRDAAFKPLAHPFRPSTGRPKPAIHDHSAALLHESTKPQEQTLTADRRWGAARSLPAWMPSWARRVDMNVVRASIESGPGGDVDADGRFARRGNTYVPSLKQTVSVWMRLHERVRRGDLSGADDGLPSHDEVDGVL
jgi:hypothetical protein